LPRTKCLQVAPPGHAIPVPQRVPANLS
jgi:hypothetical protein